MAFRVFLSHSLDPTEQPLAWRLQTLAATSGVEMVVFQHGNGAATRAAASVEKAIDRADCVLAIITVTPSQAVLKELRHALKIDKLVIPIVRAEPTGHPLLAQFPQVFALSRRDNPGAVETRIAKFLKERKLRKDEQQTIGALAAVGLGLLTLNALCKA